jgi:membrane protein
VNPSLGANTSQSMAGDCFANPHNTCYLSADFTKWNIMLKILFSFLYNVSKDFIEGQGLLRAAALTYSAMLTFIPFLLIIFFILRLLPIYDELGINIQQFIILNFVPSFGDQILEYVQLFEQQSHSLSRYSLISFIVTVMILLMALEDTLNASWRLKRKRKMGLSILMNWLMLLLGPICLLGSIIISSLIASSEWMGLSYVVNIVSTSLSLKLIPFVLSILSFSVLYYIIPYCTVLVRHALIGGLVSAVLFETAKRGMGIYLDYVPSYSVLYGTLTALPFLMLWIYMVWIIFFIGGHVTNILRLQHNSKILKA